MSLQASSRAYISTITRLSHTSERLYHQIPQISRLQARGNIIYHAASRIPCHTTTAQIKLQTQQRQTFSSSASLFRKRSKRNDVVEASSSSSSQEDDATTTAPDPFDFSQLHNGVSDAIARLKEDLQKLRSGGRFNPEAIEQLRVNLVKGSNATVRLGEVAQVVPKGGRSVVIIVGEEDLLKPVNSAIVSSNLSLTPQPDQHNPLQLNVPIPPPTKESRDQAVKAAKAAMDKASNAIRSSRATIHKRLQDMQKKKEARPDDIRKAHDQMEKVVEKAQKDIKDTFETARKTMEQV
ncbi:hypothetical protein UA08_07837 [Talaromyces atroroseus]|uniref:Ribosome recycling factor domain-containing protein n=1 Tax=Talaromyces atroroseus TaxID=1441469 RepID=A0A225A9W2_TALAT|nr:hypothetical protein UA08_07837 [Talaromyces atroroseus]OKL56870.1 hypothetical protein UA08_07837 [Talaromyces atroroseus]